MDRDVRSKGERHCPCNIFGRDNGINPLGREGKEMICPELGDSEDSDTT